LVIIKCAEDTTLNRISFMADNLTNDQIFIRKLTEIIHANLANENFGVKELVRESGISRQSLRLRLQSLTNKPINQFIRETRLRKALEMLQNENVTAAEVAYKVGFGSPAYFNTCFHEFFGYPPGQVKKTNLGNAEVISNVQVSVTQEQRRPARRTIILTSSGILLCAIIIVLGYVFFIKNSSESIAVLPFKNLSDSTSNQYFIDGIMEEILTDLCRIHDLRVIPRTSVEQFRESKESASEIAEKLDVNYLLEGSGQKYINTCGLRVQLIRAKGKETHLWAKSYELEIGDMKNYFRTQSGIAREIATELKAKITNQEEDLILQIPTNNPLAYDYYIRGKKYSYDMKWDSAIIMYSQAIKEDSIFSLAYAARAGLLSYLYASKGDYYYYWGDWRGSDSNAKADLETALKISPNSPEVKLEQSTHLYMVDRNYDKALALLDEVYDQMPNRSSFFALRGYILAQKGEWEESLKEIHKAVILDPFNPELYVALGNIYRTIRRYSEAMEFYNKPEMLGLGLEYVNQAGKFLNIVCWKGNPDEALKVIGLTSSQTEPGEIADSSNNYFFYTMDLPNNYFYYTRQFDKIIPIAEKFENLWKYVPKTLYLAHLHFLNSSISLSRKYADSAVAELNLKIKESPDDGRYYSALGYAHAFMGENRTAVENAQKAIKLMPLKLDSFQGYERELDLARIYVLTGEYDLAMDRIEYLLTVPGEFSVPMLKIDPDYDKLRALPRFQKILKTEYKTIY
jgi:TolB-like protein/AraC-like DNA-binding protein/Tfp pilus assembly protein PilF